MILHTKRLLLFFICFMPFFASAQNFETYYKQAKEAYEKQVFDSTVFNNLINEIEVKFHNYNLTLERLDSVIKICPDLSKYPDLIYYKGMIYFDKEFYSLSIKTLLEARELTKKYSLRYDISNNLGIAYTATKQIDLATRAFEEAMNIADKNKNQYDYTIAYENLLLVKIENGDLESLKKLELNFLSKNYEDLCEKLENLSLISGYYLDHNLYKQSEEILNNVAISTKTIDSCFFQKQMYYENWANISIHNNQYNKALSYLDSIPLKQIKLGVDKIETFKLYKKAYQQLKNIKKSISYNDSVVRVLEDKLEKKFIELSITNSEYKVNLTSNSDEIGRFYLHTNSKALSTVKSSLNTINVYQIDDSKLKIVGLKEEKTLVSLFNVFGKQVLQTSFKENEMKEVSIPKLAKGVYIVKIKIALGEFSKKLIVR